MTKKHSKNYFTMDELQSICESLDIETDGLKHEIIERIIARTSEAKSSKSDFDDQPSISRMVIRHSVMPMTPPALPTPIESLNVPKEQETVRSLNYSAIGWRWIPLIFTALSIGIYMLNFLLPPEYISVPVKRGWFW